MHRLGASVGVDADMDASVYSFIAEVDDALSRARARVDEGTGSILTPADLVGALASAAGITPGGAPLLQSVAPLSGGPAGVTLIPSSSTSGATAGSLGSIGAAVARGIVGLGGGKGPGGSSVAGGAVGAAGAGGGSAGGGGAGAGTPVSATALAAAAAIAAQCTPTIAPHLLARGTGVAASSTFGDGGGISFASDAKAGGGSGHSPRGAAPAASTADMLVPALPRLSSCHFTHGNFAAAGGREGFAGGVCARNLMPWLAQMRAAGGAGGVAVSDRGAAAAAATALFASTTPATRYLLTHPPSVGVGLRIPGIETGLEAAPVRLLDDDPITPFTASAPFVNACLAAADDALRSLADAVDAGDVSRAGNALAVAAAMRGRFLEQVDALSSEALARWTQYSFSSEGKERDITLGSQSGELHLIQHFDVDPPPHAYVPPITAVQPAALYQRLRRAFAARARAAAAARSSGRGGSSSSGSGGDSNGDAGDMGAADEIDVASSADLEGVSGLGCVLDGNRGFSVPHVASDVVLWTVLGNKPQRTKIVRNVLLVRDRDSKTGPTQQQQKDADTVMTVCAELHKNVSGLHAALRVVRTDFDCAAENVDMVVAQEAAIVGAEGVTPDDVIAAAGASGGGTGGGGSVAPTGMPAALRTTRGGSGIDGGEGGSGGGRGRGNASGLSGRAVSSRKPRAGSAKASPRTGAAGAGREGA